MNLTLKLAHDDAE